MISNSGLRISYNAKNSYKNQATTGVIITFFIISVIVLNGYHSFSETCFASETVQTKGVEGKHEIKPPYRTESPNINPLGKKYALLIGVQNFEIKSVLQFSELPEVKNDINELYAVLLNNGYIIKKLTSESERKPTSDNICMEIEDMARNTNFDDTFIVYFSGHGQGQYLIPYNYNPKYSSKTLQISRVTNAIKQAASNHRVLILDACRNPEIVNGQKSNRSVEPFDFSFLYKQLQKGFSLLTSCSQGEYSYINQEKGLSYFTQYLIEGLNGKADNYKGDSIKNCKVSLNEIYKYTNYEVNQALQKKHGRKQHPHIISSGDTGFAISTIHNCNPQSVELTDGNSADESKIDLSEDKWKKIREKIGTTKPEEPLKPSTPPGPTNIQLRKPKDNLSENGWRNVREQLGATKPEKPLKPSIPPDSTDTQSDSDDQIRKLLLDD